MNEKKWIVRNVGFARFGAECEVIECTGTSNYFDDQQGDFDVDHLMVRLPNGEVHHCEDYELAPAGNLQYAAICYHTRTGRVLREEIGDFLMSRDSVTVEEIANALKLDVGFTVLAMNRFLECGWARTTDHLWFSGEKLVEYREKQEKERQDHLARLVDLTIDLKFIGPTGQDQFNTYFVVDVCEGADYKDVTKAVDFHCGKMGYYGGRIDASLPGDKGRQRYRVAAHKD